MREVFIMINEQAGLLKEMFASSLDVKTDKAREWLLWF
jgi:hypothetical protein